MYHDFIFSIEATFPVFLVMVIGYFLHKFGFMTEEFCKASDKLVFKVTLPIMLMKGLVEVDLVHDFDGKYVLVCAVVTIVGILTKTCANIAGLTSPLALLSIGATFQGKKAIAKIKPTILASFIKLVVLVAVFLPIATALGFRDEKLVALIIMLGSPTTATSYIMSKNMGHEGVLSSSCIAVTTLFSSITITLWIFIFRSLGYL